MISEYIPKGYKSWHHYYTAKAKRTKWLNRLGVVAAITLLLAAYCVCGYIEH